MGAVSNQNWVEMLSFAEQAIDATYWVTKHRGMTPSTCAIFLGDIHLNYGSDKPPENDDDLFFQTWDVTGTQVLHKAIRMTQGLQPHCGRYQVISWVKLTR